MTNVFGECIGCGYATAAAPAAYVPVFGNTPIQVELCHDCRSSLKGGDRWLLEKLELRALLMEKRNHECCR